MRWYYAMALYEDDGATLDNLREAVTTLEDTERIARRVFGGAHPLTSVIERDLRIARDVCRSRSIPSVSGCALPNTRRAVRSLSTSVVTASWRSSSVPPALMSALA